MMHQVAGHHTVAVKRNAASAAGIVKQVTLKTEALSWVTRDVSCLSHDSRRSGQLANCAGICLIGTDHKCVSA